MFPEEQEKEYKHILGVENQSPSIQFNRMAWYFFRFSKGACVKGLTNIMPEWIYDCQRRLVIANDELNLLMKVVIDKISKKGNSIRV